MVIKLKKTLYVILAAALIAACSGEDGDPGPQGETGPQGEQGAPGAQGAAGTAGKSSIIKLGFLNGTVSGVRKDGTVFSETFNYEYSSDSIQAFYSVNGIKQIESYRWLNPTGDASMELKLKVQSEGVLVPQNPTYSAYFRFVKALNGDNLFAIQARPYFLATEAFVRQISYELNDAVYNFSTDGATGEVSYYASQFNGVSANQIFVYLNNTTYYSFYSVATGKLLGLRNANTSEEINSGPLFDIYNKVEFKNNSTLGMLVFYDVATGVSLHESLPDVPADQLTITNYVHDATTGVLSFDYELKISGHISNVYYRTNTTGHDLTIKGKFNSGGKVFKNTTSRIRS